MPYTTPCRACSRMISNEAAVCPNCGQPEPSRDDIAANAGLEVGKSYSGRVTSTTAFGAFVEIATGVDGLLHISEVAHERVERTEDVLKKGDTVLVKLIAIDERGRLRLSRKALI